MQFVELCVRWVKEQGVDVIGGCCRISPTMIRYLTDKLRDRESYHEILSKEKIWASKRHLMKLKLPTISSVPKIWTKPDDVRATGVPMTPFWHNKNKLAKM